MSPENIKTLELFGYRSCGRCYLKLIGYGAILIDLDGTATSLYRQADTGKPGVYAKEVLDLAGLAASLACFEAYSAKLDIIGHGPMTDLAEKYILSH